MIYLIGSLRNPQVPIIAQQLRAEGYEVFDDWYAAGPEADDKWRDYERDRGHSYIEALRGHAANHVFSFDKTHLDRADAGVLVLPAGKSGHLELGRLVGTGKPGYILLEPESSSAKLPIEWEWFTGLYEGEGCLTRNRGHPKSHGMQLNITMRDKDILERALQITKVGKLNGPYIRKNPKHSDMWRWGTRRREEIQYVVRGLWPGLGMRRRSQIEKVFSAAGVTLDLGGTPRPQEFRFDVMYKFATAVVTSVEELLHELHQRR